MPHFIGQAHNCIFEKITIMKYSKHAPKILIRWYERLTDTRNNYQTQDEEDEDDSFAQSVNYLSSKSVPHIKIEDRTVVFWAKKELHDKIAITMLGKLLSDTTEMKNVWRKISKSSIAINNGIEDENDYLLFWRACHDGILEYQNGSNLTKDDHKKQYQDIHDLALQLAEKMGQSDFFKNRANIQPRDLFWDGGIEEMLSYVKAAHHAEEDKKRCEEDFMLLFAHYMFGYKELLKNIADKANELINTKPLVLKPNEPDAHVKHFTATLSNFFRNKYGKPLDNEVVATAAVFFPGYSVSGNALGKRVRGKIRKH